MHFYKVHFEKWFDPKKILNLKVYKNESMLRTVIIDDEVKAIEGIKQMINLYGNGEIEIVGSGMDVKSGVQAINKHSPDLVLLDIKMTDGTGFDVLKHFGKIDFEVVFITAFEEYAIKAFKFSALDYILKPIDPEEFQKTLNEVVKSKEKKDLNLQLQNMMETLNQSPSEEKKLVLKTNNSIHIVEARKIIRAKSDGNYTQFHRVDDEPITISRSMVKFEPLLEEYDFIRVHQSHLINLRRVKKYLKDEYIVVMEDDSQVPVSWRRKDFLLKKFSEL